MKKFININKLKNLFFRIKLFFTQRRYNPLLVYKINEEYLFVGDYIYTYVNGEKYFGIINFGEYISDGVQHLGVYLKWIAGNDAISMRKDFLYWVKNHEIKKLSQKYERVIR